MTDDDERILNLNIDLIMGFGSLKEVTTDRDPGFGEELEQTNKSLDHRLKSRSRRALTAMSNGTSQKILDFRQDRARVLFKAFVYRARYWAVLVNYLGTFRRSSTRSTEYRSTSAVIRIFGVKSGLGFAEVSFQTASANARVRFRLFLAVSIKPCGNDRLPLSTSPRYTMEIYFKRSIVMPFGEA